MCIRDRGKAATRAAVLEYFDVSGDDFDKHIANEDSYYEVVLKDLPYTKVKAFEDYCKTDEGADVIGVRFETVYKRNYPNGSLACHLLGYTASGNVGQGGIEGYYNDYLNGCLLYTSYSDRRVLLVEDNDLNSEIASEIIGMTGASVEIVENGREAVERIENASENWYDIVFMDVQMPVINGYEATAAIRALPGRRGQIPIIAMTANAFAEDVQLAKNTGMDEHIAKPLDFEKLNTVMEKYLN